MNENISTVPLNDLIELGELSLSGQHIQMTIMTLRKLLENLSKLLTRIINYYMTRKLMSYSMSSFGNYVFLIMMHISVNKNINL